MAESIVPKPAARGRPIDNRPQVGNVGNRPHNGIKRLIFFLRVALDAVAIGGETRAPYRVTIGAGCPAGLGGSMQSLLVVERLARLRKYLGMAHGAVAPQPLVMFLVGIG